MPYLLINHEDHRHDMLEFSSLRIEIRPQIILQILTHLQNHDPLKGDRLPVPGDQKLRLIDLLHQLWIKLAGRGVRSGGLQPVSRGNLGEPVPLDLEKGDGAREVPLRPRLQRFLRQRLRRRPVNGLDGVLGDPVAAEVVSPGAVDLRHGRPRKNDSRGLEGFGSTNWK